MTEEEEPRADFSQLYKASETGYLCAHLPPQSPDEYGGSNWTLLLGDDAKFDFVDIKLFPGGEGFPWHLVQEAVPGLFSEKDTRKILLGGNTLKGYEMKSIF